MSRKKVNLQGFRDRLQEIVNEKYGGNDRKLATALGRVADGLHPPEVELPSPSAEKRVKLDDVTRANDWSPYVSRWLQSDGMKDLPSPGNLKLLCEATGYSSDWLLFNETPKLRRRRGIACDEAALEKAVEDYIIGEIAEQARMAPWRHHLASMTVDGRAFLAVGIEREVQELSEAWEFANTVASTGEPALTKVAESLKSLEWIDGAHRKTLAEMLKPPLRRRIVSDWISGVMASEFWRVLQSRVLKGGLNLYETQLVPEQFRTFDPVPPRPSK